MKKFNIRHSLSANKVGVDAVLIGAWSKMPEGLSYSPRILDAGCGCGIISMMMYQRFPDSRILGIDIEPNAILEAQTNIVENNMADCVRISNKDFGMLSENAETDAGAKFDLIVSNPPFFHSGVDVSSSESSRMIARHAGTLSPMSLISNASKLLSEEGILSFIAPAADEQQLIEFANANSLISSRICRVRGNPNVLPKRVMMEFLRDPNQTLCGLKDSEKIIQCRDNVRIEELTLEYAPGEYTPEYRELCKDFYLKF